MHCIVSNRNETKLPSYLGGPHVEPERPLATDKYTLHARHCVHGPQTGVAVQDLQCVGGQVCTVGMGRASKYGVEDNNLLPLLPRTDLGIAALWAGVVRLQTLAGQAVTQ